MPTASFSFTYTARDQTIAQALTDAFNARNLEVDPSWVNIPVKRFMARLFKQAWRDAAMRYLRDAQDADGVTEDMRLESGTSVT